jgi:secondary thiamine-phosphate synthase enzyme
MPKKTNDAPSSSSSSSSSSVPRWYQHEISITAPSRGCHLITPQVHRAIKDDLANVRIGMANIFIQHTSASLTINENADPDVLR